MGKIRVLENFSGYGSQSIALDNLNIDNEVVGISEIEPDAIIAYAALRSCDLNKVTDKSIEDMKQILMNKNVGYDFQKNKSKIPRMKKDKLIQLFNADQFSNNLGDISMINPKDVPQHDLFTYSFPCFIEGTKVMTINGYKNIEDIKTDDLVLTHTNNYQKVVKPMINQANHLYKVETMCSDTLYTTEEHPFYVRNMKRVWNNSIRRNERVFEDPKWVKVKDLNKNYYVGVAINKKSELPNWQGSTFVWSDGRKSRTSNLLKDKFDKPEFWWLIGRYIGDGWIRSGGGIIICCAYGEEDEIIPKLDKLGFNYSLSKERTTIKLHISFKEIGEYVEQFGRGAKNKHLTGDIINLPVKLLRSFIEGYKSADGCTYNNGLNKITSISEELIYGIGQCIAKAYNRPYSIYKTKRNKKTTIEGRVVNQNNTYEITWKLEKNKQDKAFYENGYVWCPIRNVEKIEYNGLVYNMEVENDNSYTVNNIIVHNCQDISVAGKTEGLEKGKTRSGLLYECEKIIEHCKPKYLLMENVKNLVGKKFKPQFDEWLEYLEGLGYTNYWQVLNAKDFGIPQNRERVFVVSILGDHKPYVFPRGFKLDKNIKSMLENNVDDKYYLSDDMLKKFIPNKNFKTGVTSNTIEFENSYIEGGLSQIISNKMYGRDINIVSNDSLKIMDIGYIKKSEYGTKHQSNTVLDEDYLMRTLTAGDYKSPQLITIKDKSVMETFPRLRIRKLTPKECFRFMGVNDEDIQKIINSGVSKTQQYKLAGNSIVVQVLEGIFKNLFITNKI